MEIEISLDYIENNYPGFKITHIEEYWRKYHGWVGGVGRIKLCDIGSIEDQLKAVIEKFTT